MKKLLDDADWDRVIFALSQFGHHTEFRETLERLRDALGRDRELS